MSRITTIDAKREVRRLQQAYSLPRGADPEAMAEAWAEALHGVSLDELTEAVTVYLRDGGRYWPPPAEIRRIALDRRRDRSDAVPTDLHARFKRWKDAEEPCPVCGAVLQTLGSHWGVPKTAAKRIGVIHDRALHQQAGVPHFGYPLSREDMELYEGIPGDAA